MDRIPKYTAGMFKKKMPRFGASSIRMPRMPKPPKPRVKKFQDGGKAEVEEVIISPEEGQKEYAELFARSERNRKARELQQSKDLVNRYLAESKKAEAAKAKEKVDKDALKKKFDTYMEERKKREQQGYSDYLREMKRGVRTARSGGKMDSSCCRGDGIAKRGKTRGRFV